ncbi:MAG: hypothetical protein WCY89_08980 [Flavobacteriaceae bacterium]
MKTLYVILFLLFTFPMYSQYYYNNNNNNKTTRQQRELETLAKLANIVEKEREEERQLKILAETYRNDVKELVKEYRSYITQEQYNKLVSLQAENWSIFIVDGLSDYGSYRIFFKYNPNALKKYSGSITDRLIKYMDSNEQTENEESKNKKTYLHKGTDVEVFSYSPILNSPDSNSKEVGKAENRMVKIIEKYNDNFYKVSSGSITGYIEVRWFRHNY